MPIDEYDLIVEDYLKSILEKYNKNELTEAFFYTETIDKIINNSLSSYIRKRPIAGPLSREYKIC